MLKLDHVVFPVRDAERTLAFYRDGLGLPLADAFGGDDWGGYPWLMMIFGLGGRDHLVCVALRGAPEPSYAGLPKDARHYAMTTESAADLDGWRGRLKAAGIDFWEEAHGDQRSIYFEDPDGVVLEVTSPGSPIGTGGEDPAALAVVRSWVADGSSCP